MNRVFNFSAGPATLPLEVLQIAHDEFFDYKGSGMSIIESSHRSPQYDEINESCIALTREIFGLGDDYHVLFMGGGASTQFAMVPMNFLLPGTTAAYINTGVWSKKAIKEAKNIGNVHIAATSEDTNFNYIPKELDVPSNAVYLHLTSNNTIFGTQYQKFPEVSVPLVCDMSSDIGSRVHDFTKFDLIYAGAQKNIGPAGATLIIISDKMLQKCNENVPTMLSYQTHAKKKSLFNTPPVFSIYIMKLVFEWIKKQGGLAAVEKVNLAKQERVYQMLDLYPDYYKGTVVPEDRSWMNITFRLPNEELEKKFIAEAKENKMSGLKGHRDVGGIRVSTYNAMSLEGIDCLVGFMEQFKKDNPA